jgi:putative FmdB family regulatory protein
MPLYDYDCVACGRRVEVVHGVHAPGPTHCPNCGSGPLRKAITAAAVHYKGAGWAKKERRATAGAGSSKAGDDAASATDGDTKDAKDADKTTPKPASDAEAPSSPTTARTTTKAAGADTATKTD